MSEPTSWHSYGKVYNLGHAAIARLLDGPVVVQEKVDGSQFSWGRFGDRLRIRSKGVEMDPEHPEKMFAEAAETARRLVPLLHDGWTYRGEYLKTPKHNALAYDRVPAQHVILFDVNTAEEEYLPYVDLVAEGERLGLEVVPQFYAGVLTEPGEMFALLERESILGGQKIEGIVIKRYDAFGPDGKVLMGKHVSEVFKEVHAANWRETNPGQGDILTRLITTYRTPARWNKAVMHLRERGELLGEPKDIGALIKEAQQDLSEECKAEMMEVLWVWARPHVLRGVTGGLAEWYKAQLVQQQFGER